MADAHAQTAASRRLRILAHLSIVAAFYILLVRSVLFSPALMLEWDNASYHLPNFVYMAESLRHGFGIPRWHPDYGGVDIGATAISLFPFMPHRLVGYALYAFTPLDALAAYKWGIVAGALGAASAWWFALFRFTGSMAGASVGALMLLLGGTGATLWHQEQVLATLFYQPFVVLSAMKAVEDRRYLPVAGVFLGAAHTVHYPHIHLLSALFLVIGLLFTLPGRRALAALIAPRQLKIAAVAFTAAVLAVLPVLHEAGLLDCYASPVRGDGVAEASSLEEYVSLNKLQTSSAGAAHVRGYIAPPRGEFLDFYGFSVTRAGLVLAIAGVALRFGSAVPVTVACALLFWAALGVNGGMPQLLFALHFPHIGFFRQWAHFVAPLNLALSALGALGASALLERIRSATPGRWARPAGVLFASLMMLAVYAEARSTFESYERNLSHKRAGKISYTKEEYLTLLSDEGFNFLLATRMERLPGRPIVMGRAAFDLPDTCYGAGMDFPFMATVVLNDAGLEGEARREALRSFCDKGYSPAGTIATLPYPGSLAGPASPISGIRVIGLQDGLASYAPSQDDLNVRVPLGAYIMTPRGFEMAGMAGFDSLLVMPFDYGLWFSASIGEAGAETMPVYGGAMTGIVVPAGEFSIEADVPVCTFLYTQWLQWALLAAAFAALAALPLSTRPVVS